MILGEFWQLGDQMKNSEGLVMQFPSDWPSDCPPPDAVDASGTVYRLAKSSPASSVDFQTHHETGKLLDAPACLRRGLSVFRDRSDAQHQFRAYPRLGRYLAEGTLAPECGVTKLTTGRFPSHSTWWVYEGVDRARLFQVVEEFQ